jgi:H+-translocating diphosphatase
MGMFTTCVFILSMSGFGPIADNAGGIAEMSQQPESVRKVTDLLDAVGNITKANTKGYSVGSASLACFLLFAAFIDEVNFVSPVKLTSVDLMQTEVFLSGLLGTGTVFLFTAWAITAVGNAAQDVIVEVRRQFKNDPGIMEGTSKPNYFGCVEIVAKAGLREMIKPGLLAVFAPIIVGIIFRMMSSEHKVLLGAKVRNLFSAFALF